MHRSASPRNRCPSDRRHRRTKYHAHCRRPGRQHLQEPTRRSLQDGSPSTHARDRSACGARLHTFREQRFFGDLAELRIAIIAVTIGERELHGLQHGVQILRAVVTHRLQVETFQDIQRLAALPVLASRIPAY